MKSKGRDRLVQAMGSAGISILLAMTLWQTGVLTGWENRVWDIQSQTFASPSLHTSDITLVLVDQESLEWVQDNMGITWPWPRELYGAIIDTINRHLALGIGFDVLFTEPSAFGVSDDAALGKSIAATKHFAAGSVFPGKTHGKHSRWPEDVPLPPLTATPGLHKSERLPSYARITMPIGDVAKHSTILCNVHHDPDPDGIYRSLHPVVFADSIPLPALGLGVYLASHPDPAVSLHDDTLSVGGADIPIDEYGRLLLRFRGPPGTYNRISAATLLKEEMEYREGEIKGITMNEQLKEKYVLFGFSAPGLFDLRPTPAGAIFSGVEINATLLDNLLSRDFISPLNKNITIPVILFNTLVLGFLIARFSGPLLMTFLALAFLLLPPSLSFTLYSFGYRFELLPLEVAIGGTIILSFMISYIREGRQRRFIKHSFEHYLSPHVIEQLIHDPDRLQLGGDRKELTIFFSDLQGFTTISEGLDPDQLIQLLNDYLSAMTDIILEEEGTIDKYEGDAIIAFWNAPLETPDHAVRAVSAALRCQKRLKELRPLFQKQCGHEMHMRIGINSGPAVVGNLGSATRFDYSMLGDAVNLAARLEGANKQFDSFTMISESTHRLLNQAFFCRELAHLTVVGRKEPIRVYEPFLSTEHTQKEKELSIFATGLKAFYDGDFQMAAIQFEKIAAVDPPARKYLDKCQFLLKNTPPLWNGVWSLTSK
jgi:adenylate cyclase